MRSINDGVRLDQLPPNTVIEIRSELEQWIVEQAYSCTEPHAGSESYHWTEYRLRERDSDDTAWLSVEFDDEEWEVELFTRQVALSEIGYERGQPFPEEVALEGDTLVLEESGKLEVTKVGTQTSYRGEYADYVRKDGKVLSIEAYPDPTNTPRETDVEVWLGHIVDPTSMEIYAASASETPDRVPQPLPSAERHEPVRAAQPVTRPLVGGMVSDPAQRTKLLIGAGVIVLLILLLVLL
jgi:Domain of unknown function (DUF4178)